MKKVAIAHQYRHLWRFYAKNATFWSVFDLEKWRLEQNIATILGKLYAFLSQKRHFLLFFTQIRGVCRNMAFCGVTARGVVYACVRVFSRWKVPFSFTLHLRVAGIACGV